MQPAETLAQVTADRTSGRPDGFCADLGVDLRVRFGRARHDAPNANDVDIAFFFESRTPESSHLDVVNTFGKRHGDGLAAALQPSVGMRNVLVHEYIRTDLGNVAEAVPLAAEQYGDHIRSLAGWLSRVDRG